MRLGLLALLISATLYAGSEPAHPFQADEASAPLITVEQLKTKLASNSVTVLDVRNSEAYVIGHIPGAVSMPLDTIKSRVSELKDKAKPIVAYCA